jgi:hypothetical protein
MSSRRWRFLEIVVQNAKRFEVWAFGQKLVNDANHVLTSLTPNYGRTKVTGLSQNLARVFRFIKKIAVLYVASIHSLSTLHSAE